MALGLGAAGIDIDRLGALLPHAEPTSTRRVGLADVQVIEKVTDAFQRQDFAHGSGLIRDSAVSQLHTVLPLLNAQLTPEVRPRLMIAAARLAMQSGWMSFECTQHDAARRLWMIGLNIARKAEHPYADDLSVFLLYDMALQAVHLGRAAEAQRLIQIARAVAGGKHPVSASTTGHLESIQARTHAAEGDAAACDHALGHAAEHYAAIDPALAPPWSGYVSEAGRSAFEGVAYYMLAQPTRDPRMAGQAVALLRHGVDHFVPGYARPRALSLPDLAGSHAIAGDTDTAVTVGHQAIDAVTAVSSPRAHDRLRTLHT
ncbi:MAG: XRE family transcriptional regulator, partial [Actinobacteria bacterium]|nr:XRE family transcriptional regulator [Actinomycetota bacterium]